MRKITILTVLFAMIFSINAQVARKNTATQIANNGLMSAKQAGIEYVSGANDVMRDDGNWFNYDGENDNAIGAGENFEFAALMKIPQSTIQGYVEKKC